MGLELHVAADDSNHAGNTGAEIIVVGFSLRAEDGVVGKWGNRRDPAFAERFFDEMGRDWRFTLRGGDQYRHSGNNLAGVLPTILGLYLPTLDWDLSKISVYLDGRIADHRAEKLRRDILEVSNLDMENISVAGFIKKSGTHYGGEKKNVKGGFHKGYFCPEMLWAVDSIANMLYNYKSFRRLASHPRLIGPRKKKR